MSSLRGPRRTRVYDANYNIGQSYYKPALDRLDRKYNGRPEVFESSPTRPVLNIDNGFDEDLQSLRARASRAITEESAFDSRGGRTTKGIPLSSAFDDGIDEEVQDSLNRMRANKSKTRALINDLDFEDSINTVKRRANRDLGEKLLDLAGEDDLGDAIRTRALKMVSRADDGHESLKSVNFKRTTISENETANSAASMRAQATKARLADMESEMFDRSEKLLQREKRAANLKRILADNDIEVIKPGKHVSF